MIGKRARLNHWAMFLSSCSQNTYLSDGHIHQYNVLLRIEPKVLKRKEKNK